MNCSLIFKSKHQYIVHLFFLFFSLTIKDKTKISLTINILHLRQGSFTRKVRTIFTLKIIVSIFVKLFLILVLHLRKFFIVRFFVKRATVLYWYKNQTRIETFRKGGVSYIFCLKKGWGGGADQNLA